MFTQIKSVVDLIRSGVTDFRNFKSDKERNDTLLDLSHVGLILILSLLGIGERPSVIQTVKRDKADVNVS